MSENTKPTSGPDLAAGIAITDIADGVMLQGHVGEETVLLARRGDEFFAVGATCTHYHGPLAEGLMVGDTVRCPWHHAFSLRTGAAVRPPAGRATRRDGVVGDELPAPKPPMLSAAGLPDSVVIVGGSAAGNAAAETLRQDGYAGPITLLSADASRCDRRNSIRSTVLK